MPSTRPAGPSIAVALCALSLAACGPRTDGRGTGPTPESGRLERNDVALVLTLTDSARTIDRLAAQYGRLVEALESAGAGVPLPPADAARDSLRMFFRNQLFRSVLEVPNDFAVELAAPAYLGVSLPRSGPIAAGASIPILPSESPPRGGPSPGPGGLTVEAVGPERVALGYQGAPAMDFAALRGVAALAEDDYVLQLWGVPGAERARRLLLGWSGQLRSSGGMDFASEIVVAVASSLLARASDVEEARAALRFGGPDEPAVAVRLELTPVAGSTLAAVCPAGAEPSGAFPFLGAVPAGPRNLIVSQAAPGDDALIGIAAELIDRLFAMFASTAPPDLAGHVTALGTAADDLLHQLDGAWLDASWTAAPAGDRPAARLGAEDLFLLAAVGVLPTRTMILGVRDAAAALDAVRRACNEIRELGPSLDALFGGPLDVACEREAGAAGETEIDRLSLRQKILPGDLESGRRPYSADVYFATSGDRLVMAVGEEWRERIGWALADSAPDGGLAADARWTARKASLPAAATSFAWLDIASAALAVTAPGCDVPPEELPPLTLQVWSGVEDGRGVAVVESSADLAGELAALVEPAGRCGVLW
jgi:hypothetical protein